MQLTRAFTISQKEVVSFVGGGGKTTAMFRLADELVEQNKRVVTTTTTRIFAAQIKLAPYHIRAENEEQALRDLGAALKQHSHVLVIGTTTQEGKAFGVAPTLVDRIAAMEQVDVVLNEADGSRMRSFKAPGEHEPVIPASSTLLVPVVGIDGIGAPLDEEHVHRPERVAELAGVSLGTTIEPDLIARVIDNEQGGLKNRPRDARAIPFVNKVENVAQLLTARDIAGQLLKGRSIDSVAIGSAKNLALPVAEVHRRVAAVVLAAGGATRMQGPLKQLLPWRNSTLVRHTLDVVTRTLVNEMVLVVGKNAEAVEREGKETRARVAFNPDWGSGRSTSVRAGLKALSSNAAAAIFVNADQPFLTANVIDMILHRYYQTLAPIVIPVYDGATGSPVLFGRELFDELKLLTGDDGGRKLLQARTGEAEYVNIVNIRAAYDLDTMEQYRAALAYAQADPAERIASTVPTRE